MADRASPVFRFNPPSPPSQSIHEYDDESDGHRSRSSPPASFEVAVERPPSLSPVLEDLQGLPRSPEARVFQSLNPSNSPRRAHGGAPIDDRGHDHDDGLATRPMDDYVPSYEQPPHSQSRNPSRHHPAHEQEPSMYHENMSYGRTAPGSLRHASTHSYPSDDRPTFDPPPVNLSPHSCYSQHESLQPSNPVTPSTSPSRSYNSYNCPSSIQPAPGEYYRASGPPPSEDVAPAQASRAPRWNIPTELPTALRRPDIPHRYTQIGPTDPSYSAFNSQSCVAPVQSYPAPYRHYEHRSDGSPAQRQRPPLYHPSEYIPNNMDSSAFPYGDPRMVSPTDMQPHRARVSVEYVSSFQQDLGGHQQFDDFQDIVVPNPDSFRGGAEIFNERGPIRSEDDGYSPDTSPVQGPLVDTAPTMVRSGELSDNLGDYLFPSSGDSSKHRTQPSLSYQTRYRPPLDVRPDEGETSTASDGGVQLGAPPPEAVSRESSNVDHHSATLSRDGSKQQTRHSPQSSLLQTSYISPLDIRAGEKESTDEARGSRSRKPGSSQQGIRRHPPDATSDHVGSSVSTYPFSMGGTEARSTAVGDGERNGLSSVVGAAVGLKRNEIGFQIATSSDPLSSLPTPKGVRKMKLEEDQQQYHSTDNWNTRYPSQQSTASPMRESQVFYEASPFSGSIPLRPGSAQSETSSMHEAHSATVLVFHPNNGFWVKCRDEAKAQDGKLMQQWNNAIDVLLVFAALFSAVLTAFLMEFYKFLEPEPATISSQLLQNIAITLQILVAQENIDDLPSVSQSMEAPTSTAVLWVNGQWFVSLTCSIGVAISGMVVKQWLQYYDQDMGGLTAYEYVQRRQYRHSGLLKWKVPIIVTALPIAMHISVALFLSGMVLQLFLINDIIAMIVLVMLAIYGSAYIFVTVVPLFDSECPYKSPMAIFFQRLSRLIAALPLLFTMALAKFCNAVCRPLTLTFRMSTSALLPVLKKVYGYSRTTAESREIKCQEQSLKANAVLWMLNSCQNSAVIDEALTAVASLECDEAIIKKFHTFDVPEMLVSRASLPLPPLEHEFWSRLPVLDKKSMNVIASSSAPTYIGSLLRLWHHPTTYDIMSRDPVSITRASGVDTVIKPQKHRWMFGNWVYVWRQLGMLMETSGMTWSHIQNLGWSKEIFVAFLCSEATYYHLCISTTQAFSQVSDTDDLWDTNPVPDLQRFLEMHTSGKLPLDEKLLVMVLDTLLFLLSNVNSPSHLVSWRDVLMTLLKLMSLEESQDIAVARRLSGIMEMFASKPGDQMQVYRAYIGRRGVMRRQDAYASIKRSVYLLLKYRSNDTARSELISEDATATPSEIGVQVSEAKPIQGSRFSFFTRINVWRVKPSSTDDLETGSRFATAPSDVSTRATPRPPDPSSHSRATSAKWVKQTVQPKSKVAIPVQQKDIPSERPPPPAQMQSVLRAPSDSPDVLDFDLPFFETAQQFFRFTVWHNDSDPRGGDLLLDLPTNYVSEILRTLPQDKDQWGEYKSLAWILRLLIGWYLRDEMPRKTQIVIIKVVEHILAVLRSKRRTEVASRVLPFFADRLRTSTGPEFELFGQALYTFKEDESTTRRRRFIRHLIRAGVIEVLVSRLHEQSSHISPGLWKGWSELFLAWEKDLTKHPWTAEEKKACSSIVQVFREDQ